MYVHIYKTTNNLCFCDWLISLKKPPSGFTYFAAYIRLCVSTCATAESRTLYDKIPPYAYSTCLPFKHLFKNFYFIYILSPNHLMLRILLLFTENETPTSMCPYIQCNINCNGKTMNKTIDEDKDDA